MAIISINLSNFNIIKEYNISKLIYRHALKEVDTLHSIYGNIQISIAFRVLRFPAESILLKYDYLIEFLNSST